MLYQKVLNAEEKKLPMRDFLECDIVVGFKKKHRMIFQKYILRFNQGIENFGNSRKNCIIKIIPT